MSANKTESEKLLYKLILQFTIYSRGSHSQLDPHLVKLTQSLKQGVHLQELTPELIGLSKTLSHLSSPAQSVSRENTESATQKLLKDLIERLNSLLEETEIPLKLQAQYKLIRQKAKTNLDDKGLKKIIDLALSLLVDIKNHAISEQQGLEAFLNDISKQFSKLEGQASSVSISNEKSIENNESLGIVINQQVDNIKTCSENAIDIATLQDNISQHLKELSHQVIKHQKTEIDRQLENNKQLKYMSQQLNNLETEAETLRNNLKIATDKALSDILTGLPNRTAYDERAKLEYQRWKRYHSPLSLIIWDIDLFKSINDSYGHKAGDKTLALVGQLILKSCRDTDFVARYGGEEFVMLLPNTNAQQALLAAEKIRVIIEKSGFNHNGQSIKLTISCGISEFLNDDEHDTVFERADQALYQSKEQGRNRCTINTSQTGE